MSLSVAIITCNEERNLRRTLESLRVADAIVIVDSGSTDRTVDIARELGAKVFVEPWKGYAAQKNSAIEKCTGDWILSLDADEAVSEELAAELEYITKPSDDGAEGRREWCLTMSRGRPSDERDMFGFWLPRKNFFLGRWIRHGGFWPDAKLRLFRRGKGRFEERPVHETMVVDGPTGRLNGAMLHHAYPTLEGYIAQMNRYSTLGAQMATAGRKRGFSVVHIVLRPALTFIYNYLFRLGFLDGREGLLLHLYHAGYVSWKYAKAWEASKEA
jgi:glycosyltransferase involved in cell wall biosynthesis